MSRYTLGEVKLGSWVEIQDGDRRLTVQVARQVAGTIRVDPLVWVRELGGEPVVRNPYEQCWPCDPPEGA